MDPSDFASHLLNDYSGTLSPGYHAICDTVTPSFAQYVQPQTPRTPRRGSTVHGGTSAHATPNYDGASGSEPNQAFQTPMQTENTGLLAYTLPAQTMIGRIKTLEAQVKSMTEIDGHVGSPKNKLNLHLVALADTGKRDPSENQSITQKFAVHEASMLALGTNTERVYKELTDVRTEQKADRSMLEGLREQIESLRSELRIFQSTVGTEDIAKPDPNGSVRAQEQAATYFRGRQQKTHRTSLVTSNQKDEKMATSTYTQQHMHFAGRCQQCAETETTRTLLEMELQALSTENIKLREELGREHKRMIESIDALHQQYEEKIQKLNKEHLKSQKKTLEDIFNLHTRNLDIRNNHTDTMLSNEISMLKVRGRTRPNRCLSQSRASQGRQEDTDYSPKVSEIARTPEASIDKQISQC
ncbi:hypothetical protein AOL_s00088g8 [Orbilia oligospora ATCC 24927]|uniref:Uncharacterized protein n=1 Tax=Arthrobotrys oligospora (strain ATCC 24927 / CBS 115.81 / DSM 1491) TaxID=756982 RepID=G1XHP5_ARTOA|nr:hypothetical protein AOL_s00088g8 [Orbilia oligospora ATCC 24927]EGX47293.1 hypothetical protein AOL_s00088g8 [Orbilia oligospora ATCC 24927]